VLNLDAAWGNGKTFFLERFKRHLEAAGYLVAGVNAWRDDHAEDPLIAVMSAIDNAVEPHIGRREDVRKAWQTVKRHGAAVAIAATKGAAMHWTRKAIGEGLDQALEAIGARDNGQAATATTDATSKELASILDDKAKALLAGFRRDKRSIAIFRKELARFLESVSAEGHRVPLFVLVDELDRCRPPYAIALLERVKHLFDIDNVVFVIATDTGQLHHAIGAVYGTGFDSQRYLLRFFDRSYVFEHPSLEQFVAVQLKRYGLDPNKVSVPLDRPVETFVSGAFSYFGLSLRDAEQCFDILRSIVTVWNVAVPLELGAVLPLVIGYQQGLEPTLNADFGARLQELAARNRGRVEHWRFKLPASRYSKREPEEGSYLNFFASFARAGGEALPDLTSTDSGSVVTQWVSQRFSMEMNILHHSSWRGDQKPLSVIRSYPSIIRSAGRLLPSVQRGEKP
jgi:hypothetical protein